MPRLAARAVWPLFEAAAEEKSDERPHPRGDDPGHRLECRQVDPGGGPRPCARPPRAAGRAVQAAEHVEQRGGRGRRRRDRTRPGGAGARRAAAAERAHEPGAAEAGDRHGRAGDRPGPPRRDAAARATSTRAQDRPDAGRARQLRAAGARRRHRPGRRRRQPGRDQPARRRYRQHGLRGGGGCAGADRRRHRSRRRHREPGRHPCGDRSRPSARASAASSSTSSAAICGCSTTASRRSSGSPHGPVSAWCRGCRKPHGCRPRMRSISSAPARRESSRLKVVVPMLARIANFDDLDPLGMEPDVALDIRPAGRADSGRCRRRHPAGLQVDHRRSRIPARAGLGHRHQGACAARRSRARPVRRLPDARPQHRRS